MQLYNTEVANGAGVFVEENVSIYYFRYLFSKLMVYELRLDGNSYYDCNSY